MNLVELAKVITEDQIANSKELGMSIIYKDMSFFEYSSDEHTGRHRVLECDVNYLLTEDWEIELPYVDFWTAYQSARKEGWAIKSEHREFPTVVDDCSYFDPKEIDGLWQILNR